MKKCLLLFLCAVGVALAADPAPDKSFLQDLEQKAKVIALAVPPAEKLLPSDTLGFLTVPDWAKAQAGFTNSATGQLWADPAMKGFKEAFFDKFNAEKIQPLEKELGFQFTNFLNLARGQFTLGVVPNGWDGRSERQPGVLWLMDARENASQLRTNLADLRKKWTESGRKMRTEKIRDVEFTVVIVDAQEIGKSIQQLTPGPKAQGAADEPTAARTVEWVIGQSGPLLVVSDAAKDVEKVLALQSGVAVPALAEQAVFAPSAGLQRNAQAFAWVNVKTIMATLARKPAERPGEQKSIFGPMPTLESILGAFGLNGVQSIAFNWQHAAEGSTANISVRVPESGRKGLFNILAVDAKDASAPPFVPADAVKFSRWRIDLQKAWSTIETVLLEVSPQYAGFSKLILDTAGKDKDPSFDFRKQLLANMGDDVISYEKAPRGTNVAAPSLTLVGSKNAPQMAASLRAVTSIFPPEMIKYSERDFLGRKVYSVVIPSMGADNKPRPLTYAASGGYVAFSTDAATLEEYLRSGEGNVKPLREWPGLNGAAQNVGGTGSGYFSFQNQAETARAAFESANTDPAGITEVLGAGQLTTILGMLGGDGKSTADLIDVTKLPAFEKVAKYFHFDVSAIGVTPDAITFKTFTPTPPALRK
jgi:hypothetical protein